MKLRICRGDMHCDIAHQFLEIIRARDEIRLAIHFNQDAQLGARVDVCSHGSLLGGARRFLAGGGNAALAQHYFGVGDISLCFCESALALHHSSPGSLAELLH